MAMPGWYADPLGVHEKRFFDGQAWTDRVMDGDVEGSNPLGNLAPPPPFTPTVSGVAPQLVGSPYGNAPQYGVPQYGVPQYGAPQYVAQQYVVVAPHQVGNGLAVAALVLGIIGVVLAGWALFGLICAVLALVFGVLGRLRAAQGASSGGLATAGIVLGCIGIVLGSYILLAWNRVGNAITSSIARSQKQSELEAKAVDADPSANKVRVTSCYRDPTTNAPAANGTLVNSADVKKVLRVTIKFGSPSVSSGIPNAISEPFGSGVTEEVSPGDSATWTARGLDASFTPTSCTVVRSAAANP